jgi:hypothetical protein
MTTFLSPCRFTVWLNGLSNFTVKAAVAGFGTPENLNVIDQKVYRYYAENLDGTVFERGSGLYDLLTHTLIRQTITDNSDGTSSKIDFAAAPQVTVFPSKPTTLESAAAASVPVIPDNNILLNSGMEIDQEHNGSATTVVAGQYAIDGWVVSKSGTMVCTVQQVSDAPPGFYNSLKLTVNTAQSSIGSSEYIFIYQILEAYRTSQLAFGSSAAQSSVLGFWTKIHRAGAYSGSIRNYSGSRSFPFSFTQNVADIWEYKTVSVPGDVVASWVGNSNAASMLVIFTIACGATLAGPAGAWASINYLGAAGTTNGVAATSDVFQIAGVSLLPGTTIVSAANSPLLKRSYPKEILLCSRYYYRLDATQTFAYALMNTALYRRYSFKFLVPMRVAPTVSFSATSGAGSFTSLDVSAVSPQDVQFVLDLPSDNYAYLTQVIADARLL